MAGGALESVAVVTPLVCVVFDVCVPYNRFCFVDRLEYKGCAVPGSMMEVVGVEDFLAGLWLARGEAVDRAVLVVVDSWWLWQRW